jgi:uncharacterized damage-inducible protein DinB
MHARPITAGPRAALALTVVSLTLAAGCARPTSSAEEAAPTEDSPTATTVAAANTGCDAQRELDGLDTRRPVPLQPMMALHQKQNMQKHLEVVQRVIDALAREDFDAVAAASKEIEPSTSMTQMCNHMGAGAEGFTPQALMFHDRARAISEGARARDPKAVLAGLSSTLQACTGCHATYRQDVVTAVEWERRTGQVGPGPGQMHGGEGMHHTPQHEGHQGG